MKSLRVIFYIPISVLAFFCVFFLIMLICSLLAMLGNVSDNFRYFLSDQPSSSIRGTIALLVSSAVAGFFASYSYFQVGKRIFPIFSNKIYRKIALYLMLIILGLIFIFYTAMWFSMGEIILPICLIIVIVTLLLAFISTLNEIDY